MAMLQPHFPTLSVRQLCRILGISRSWYQEQHARPSATAEAVRLRDAIEQLILDFPGYGYRRVTKALQRDGWHVNHKCVLRVMRAESLLCQLKRHFVTTTDSQHGLRIYPNLLRGLVVRELNQVWVADITYIRLPTAFAYLACVLDAYSRRCIGWHLSRTIDTQLALQALSQAVGQRQPAPGLIHHSDRGVQYASLAYVARVETAGARLSMAATGNPYENAKAERFFKTLKHEEVYLNDYQSFSEAEDQLDRFIGDVYNTKRLHSRLGYLPPTEFEAAIESDRGLIP